MRTEEAPGRDRPAAEVVLAFLACGERRDFAAARDLLDPAICRVGPDGDVKQGRDDYLAYLTTILGDVADYKYRVHRCAVSDTGLTVVVELEESLTEVGGRQISVSEAMIFDLTPGKRIRRLSVYMKVPPGTAP